MGPGFFQLGVVVVVVQLLFIAAVYAYLRYRYPLSNPATRRRVTKTLAGGVGLATIGQLTALGAPTSVWVTNLSFSNATVLSEAGVATALIGYGAVLASFAFHSRAAR
ncbi:hypothetical protein [Halomarina rubra]|uniref:Uncharacterized protein n=1 Tax=Halomarina rubra TaxID=2071873 RepID=A0ABD6AUB3_9EURY|nr:hypothetical protein [Halomarina rubra]